MSTLPPHRRWLIAAARQVLRPPPALPALLARARPVIRDGQQLDPQVQWMLALQRLTRRPALDHYSPAGARRRMAVDQLLADGPALPMTEVRELSVQGAAGPLAARLYRPTPSAQPGPGLLYFHGGGFVVGGLASHDGACRVLARASGAAVLAVDYRLAPEHVFPAAAEDALAIWRWLSQRCGELGLDPARLAVGGDSAGATLAALVTHRGPALTGVTPRFQLLIYPSLDRAGDYPSRALFQEGFLLTGGLIKWFMGHYLPDGGSLADPRLSPLRFEDFRGLPPAHVLTAGFDPLRDEGEAYALRLREAGVAVSSERAEGLFHGFLQSLGIIAEATRALERAGACVRDGLR